MSTASPWEAIATPAMGALARRRQARLASLDPVAAQRGQLQALVRRAKDTRFGRDHDFKAIVDVADYQRRVPLRTYDQLWNAYWRDPFPNLVDVTWPGQLPFFAVSSGTASGRVKYIPCSDAMVRSNSRAALDTLVWHFHHRPRSRLFHGAFFMLGGSTDLTPHGQGVLSGDISGIAAHRQPWWTKPWVFPPPHLRFLTDWEEKLGEMGPLSLTRTITGLSGSPAWMLVLFDYLAQHLGRPDASIRDLYPELELIIHGGVGFAPYQKRFADLMVGSRAELREVYAASEGYVAIADRGPGEGMRLSLDNGLFCEFIPTEELDAPEPTRHWVADLETGVDYAVALTTCAGLWSYLIGDVVRFVDRNPPRLLITGRTSYMLSAFGEHLTGELIENCVLAAGGAIEATVAEFSVGVEVAEERRRWGRHVFVVEFAGALPPGAAVAAFGSALDRTLGERNEDYRERRAVATGLQGPRIVAVPQGYFNAWLKGRGKLGGQHKVPRVINDPALFQDLLAAGGDSARVAEVG